MGRGTEMTTPRTIAGELATAGITMLTTEMGGAITPCLHPREEGRIGCTAVLVVGVVVVVPGTTGIRLTLRIPAERRRATQGGLGGGTTGGGEKEEGRGD